MAKGRGAGSAGATPALGALSAAGVEFRVHEYEHDPRAKGFGLEAAAATGAPAERVHKTLVADTDRGLVVGVVPVDRQLSMKQLAAAAGAKRAALAEQAAAERSTGYVRGGISPFGQKRRLVTVLDAAAMDHPTIFVSGGRRGLEIELTPAELVRVLDAIVHPIAM